ncbi:MAG: diacylglycerol kinase family protein [archaeon]
MKIKLIINPAAGIQKKNLVKIKNTILSLKQITPEMKIKNFFEKKGLKIDVEETKKQSDATNIAKKSKNYDIIIAAGGDGTINEVINGMQNHKTKLGIIPLGSENVMAKELNIPLRITNACKTIIKGNTRKIDIGTINNKKFIFVAGVGFDAEAITNVQPILKKLLGGHAYTLAGLKTLFSHKPEELTIIIDGKKEKAYFAIVTNIKTYGAGIVIASNAEMDDGYLDLCLFKNKDLWSVMKYVVGAASGKMSKLKGIEQHKIKKAEITSKKKVSYHTDAEIGGTTPIKIAILKEKLSVIVP